MTSQKDVFNVVITNHSIEKILSRTSDCVKTFPASRRRSRRCPTVFSVDQKELLEEVFETDMYPDVNTRERLAEELGVAESRIQVWFQNRRSRLRRSMKMKFQTASRYAAISVMNQVDCPTFTPKGLLYSASYVNPVNQLPPFCTSAYWSPVLPPMSVCHQPPQQISPYGMTSRSAMNPWGTYHQLTLPVSDTFRAAETRVADMTSSSVDCCVELSTNP